ncbi:MAG: hypothetical protein ACOX4M_09940 [Acetivibrionales bacterium]|jgi:hypothetical protein
MQFINLLASDQAAKIFSAIKNFIRTLPSRAICIIPEDTRYKWHIIKDYMPGLYHRHIIENKASCLFCANLVRGGCHKHCLKCSIGTHIKCGPSLPGAIYKMPLYLDEAGYTAIPWFYRKPCGDFKRLPPYLYFKNLYPILGMAGTCNLEILEGLLEGLSSGIRPCHVCASVDYGLYKKCLSGECFDENTPCSKICSEIEAYYKSLSAKRDG